MIMNMTEESSEAAYDRGVRAGDIAARLANHDLHFKQINGHISDLTTEVRGMRLDIQRLADQAEASAQTALATTKALRAADRARWSPWARSFATLSAVATVLSIITMIIVLRS